MKNHPKLLGVTASLRNVCWGIGNQELINSLKSIFSDQLFDVFADQPELRLKHFLKSGRTENKSSLEVTVISKTIKAIND